jgi:hypothetical protein
MRRYGKTLTSTFVAANITGGVPDPLPNAFALQVGAADESKVVIAARGSVAKETVYIVSVYTVALAGSPVSDALPPPGR